MTDSILLFVGVKDETGCNCGQSLNEMEKDLIHWQYIRKRGDSREGQEVDVNLIGS